MRSHELPIQIQGLEDGGDGQRTFRRRMALASGQRCSREGAAHSLEPHRSVPASAVCWSCLPTWDEAREQEVSDLTAVLSESVVETK